MPYHIHRRPPLPPQQTLTSLRPYDDFAIIQLYNQLYLKVRAFSSQFLGHGISPVSTPPELSRIVSYPSPAHILTNKSLHRNVIEGLIGAAIQDSVNLHRGGPEEVLNTLLRISKTPTPVKRLLQELQKVFELARRLKGAFETQRAVGFAVSFPRTAKGFDKRLMVDKGGGSEGVGGGRDVGVLVFPGVFKVTKGVRECMVKVRVVCADEIRRYLDRV
ncbi:hypothetical protein K440DRAFT_643279 [Wilcoxina mikolae CBS 423.85]|nr:hypothetical protein K440DRAFT_643279 [Wilcoxina mikolae CBS 423.85]